MLWFIHRNTRLESSTVPSWTLHITPPPTHTHTHPHSTVCGHRVSGWVSFTAALTIISKFIHANSVHNWFRSAHSKNRCSHCDCRKHFGSVVILFAQTEMLIHSDNSPAMWHSLSSALMPQRRVMMWVLVSCFPCWGTNTVIFLLLFKGLLSLFK